MEIEVKYLIDDPGKIPQILEDGMVCGMVDLDSEEILPMAAIYFDTEDRRLSREDMVFRVRKEGDHMVATLKWNGSSEDGLHKREEINLPVEGEGSMYAPDPTWFAHSPATEKLQELLRGRPLVPVMKMFFERHQMRLDSGKSIWELSIDTGEIQYDGKTAPIQELEIELYAGDEKDMISFGEKLAAKYQLSQGLKSKFKQGLDLAGKIDRK